MIATAGDRNLRDGSDTDQRMKKADLALYISKTNGGSVYLFFEEQMEARMQERRALEFALYHVSE